MQGKFSVLFLNNALIYIQTTAHIHTWEQPSATVLLLRSAAGVGVQRLGQGRLNSSCRGRRKCFSFASSSHFSVLCHTVIEHKPELNYYILEYLFHHSEMRDAIKFSAK